MTKNRKWKKEKKQREDSILVELKSFFKELDAAYYNRDGKRSTTGICITL